MSATPPGQPRVIQGKTVTQPRLYGQESRQNYQGVFEQGQDEFIRTGSPQKMQEAADATVRYAPEGKVTEQGLTHDGVESAIGSAEQEVQIMDKDGDGALSGKDILDSATQPVLAELNRLKAQVTQNPKLSDQDYQKLLKLDAYAAALPEQVANWVAAADCADPATDKGDGKLTADEIAAKTIADDGIRQLVDDPSNMIQLEQLFTALNPQSGSAGFNALKQKIGIIKSNAKTPMQKDGQVTKEEREVSDTLTQASPLLTNVFVSAIRDNLGLKQWVNGQPPSAG